jgi:hypothetical protein
MSNGSLSVTTAIDENFPIRLHKARELPLIVREAGGDSS